LISVIIPKLSRSSASAFTGTPSLKVAGDYINAAKR
jgi:hypothetical protein